MFVVPRSRMLVERVQFALWESYIAIHQVSLLSHASYSYSAGGVRCPRQRRQRVTEGTAMAHGMGPITNISRLHLLHVTAN